MKVIFLDIDGVLNNINDNITSGEILDISTLFSESDIDIIFIKRLNQIINKTNAKVVISSSWRKSNRTKLGLSIDELKAVFKNKEFKGEIIDFTPHLYRTKNGICQDRIDEIQYWLDHNLNVKNFVILDDSFVKRFKDKFPNNFVYQVNGEGLQEDQVEKAIKILTNS